MGRHVLSNSHSGDGLHRTASRLEQVLLGNEMLLTFIFLFLHLWQPALDFLCYLLGGIAAEEEWRDQGTG